MDLMCNEKEMFKDHHHQIDNHMQQMMHIEQQQQQQVNTASADPTFLSERCLENLLKSEETHPVINFYNNPQCEITPKMRRIVAEWMMEVCEENKCQEEVFILALNYMDRFLALTPVPRTQLQILAAACLLLASKLREPSVRGLPADLLVFYTDNSITRRDLIQWELIVLNKLKWNISSVTPLDFLEHLLVRLPINKQHTDVSKIKKHAQAFISLAAREHNFSIYSASTTAASSIAASLYGMDWHIKSGISISSLLDLLKDLTGVEKEYLETCMNKLENLFEQHQRLFYSVNITAQNMPQNNNNSTINNNNNYSPGNVSITATTNSTTTTTSTINCNATENSASNTNSLEMTPTKQPNIEIASKSQSGTPTDVQDVTF
ncbi:G1/S-specific cyclin-D2 [Sitodiplosis mosellana]|uniref:G1/S-specific cyclin-D2 n=1 Tax=Sitodiplosis mosellana TaxID=263140 RepID=UPI0024448CD0|nr:G1/S-specific cyclin-D2 [Sitodiplosis mosellana]XP_055300324.1 G1/S-specific cyclin-D2 [Sitodiplosis mosellana]XP_055300325.1 G1/S-specific cyclin-D2 [Sitodiplosis mosellana]XP_055300327.1 G1/S-specific cyclin-D2 [Sitodiplosis mosellana]XP_055300328.1 G1/S-specific cyclin-D2 [Sitodiplosis mosellana]XP_055300329.1 G1/S-specific cyclin-D2 [Sitodiplosis mosellana]XP_055300330.1 G1/S-specific cyclin-D2 [Sitodiplosis mosellana]XP_055300331.1 G1/S-specific cyclin-D2 [Sitodiplosis mosellana]